MNRRDLLKSFAAVMATLPFFGKVKTVPSNKFELKFADDWPGDWFLYVNESVTMHGNGYITIGDEMIEITPGGGWTPIEDVYGPTITIKYNDDMSHY